MDFVYVGKIVKPQGIKGEVKIRPSIILPEIFDGEHKLYIEKKEAPFTHCTFRLGFAYVFFNEIADRIVAEKYRNKKIYISQEDFEAVSASENAFLVSELVGILLYDEKSEFVGQIMDVTDYGFDDIIIVKEDNHLYEVPFKKEIFVHSNDTFYVIRKEFNGAKVSQV